MHHACHLAFFDVVLRGIQTHVIMIVQKAVYCLSHLPTLFKVNYLLYTKPFLIKEYSRSLLKLKTIILQFNQLWEELLRAIFSYLIEQRCRLRQELALEALQFIRRAEKQSRGSCV